MVSKDLGRWELSGEYGSFGGGEGASLVGTSPTDRFTEKTNKVMMNERSRYQTEKTAGQLKGDMDITIDIFL